MTWDDRYEGKKAQYSQPVMMYTGDAGMLCVDSIPRHAWGSLTAQMALSAGASEAGVGPDDPQVPGPDT